LLLEYFDIEYIEGLELSEVLVYLNSLNDSKVIERVTEWYIQQEIDIDREINNRVDGKEAVSVEFQRWQLRKKRFKGYRKG
jgi:hypothetical protein